MSSILRFLNFKFANNIQFVMAFKNQLNVNISHSEHFGESTCRRKQKGSSFAFYDLSKDESIFNGQFSGPMKRISEEQLKVRNSGKRSTYLNMRYKHSPDSKYYYPEATSWRYGWLHNIKCKTENHKLNT